MLRHLFYDCACIRIDDNGCFSESLIKMITYHHYRIRIWILMCLSDSNIGWIRTKSDLFIPLTGVLFIFVFLYYHLYKLRGPALDRVMLPCCFWILTIRILVFKKAIYQIKYARNTSANSRDAEVGCMDSLML